MFTQMIQGPGRLKECKLYGNILSDCLSDLRGFALVILQNPRIVLVVTCFGIYLSIHLVFTQKNERETFNTPVTGPCMTLHYTGRLIGEARRGSNLGKHKHAEFVKPVPVCVCRVSSIFCCMSSTRIPNCAQIWWQRVPGPSIHNTNCYINRSKEILQPTQVRVGASSPRSTRHG